MVEGRRPHNCANHAHSCQLWHMASVKSFEWPSSYSDLTSFFNCFSKSANAKVLCKFFCQIIMGSPSVPACLGHVQAHVNFSGGHFICIARISSFCTFSFPESLKSWSEILLSTKNLLLWTKDQPIIEILNIKFFHHPHLPFAKLHFLRLLLSVLDSNKQCHLWVTIKIRLNCSKIATLESTKQLFFTLLSGNTELINKVYSWRMAWCDVTKHDLPQFLSSHLDDTDFFNDFWPWIRSLSIWRKKRPF